jgi:hypothetical protein
MDDPTIEILGVYRFLVTDEVFQSQLPMYGDEDQCRHHFSSVVLVEAVARNLDDRFNMGDFTQRIPAYPGGSAQVAYDEAVLSQDGGTLLARTISCMRKVGTGPVRFAYYLHFYDGTLPLLWTYGEIPCPPVGLMPLRLQVLVPYRPCD